MIIDESIFCVFCGNGVDGKKPFLIVRRFPCDDLAEGDAKEWDLALRGEMAGPNRASDEVLEPTLDPDVSVNERCQGLSESLWCETVKENLEEEHEPILADPGTFDGSNRRDAALGYDVKSSNSKDSSKSSDEITVVNGESSTNGFTPYTQNVTTI